MYTSRHTPDVVRGVEILAAAGFLTPLFFQSLLFWLFRATLLGVVNLALS